MQATAASDRSRRPSTADSGRSYPSTGSNPGTVSASAAQGVARKMRGDAAKADQFCITSRAGIDVWLGRSPCNMAPHIVLEARSPLLLLSILLALLLLYWSPSRWLLFPVDCVQCVVVHLVFSCGNLALRQCTGWDLSSSYEPSSFRTPQNLTGVTCQRRSGIKLVFLQEKRRPCSNFMAAHCYGPHAFCQFRDEFTPAANRPGQSSDHVDGTSTAQNRPCLFPG